MPMSRLKEVIERWFRDADVDLNLGTELAESLARYITINTFKVMQEEKLPTPALLQAACLVITNWMKTTHEELEIYDNGPACNGIVVGRKTGEGCADTNLSQALLQFAERITQE